MASIGNHQDLGIKLTAIPDATIAGSSTLTDSDASLGATSQAELEGVLTNLGDTINLVIAALEEAGILTPN
jgi:hypothetical protein